jgi:hypothetical protein
MKDKYKKANETIGILIQQINDYKSVIEIEKSGLEQVSLHQLHINPPETTGS